MLRLLLVSTAMFLSGCATTYSGQNSQKQSPTTPAPPLSRSSVASSGVDGAYRFVSRTTTLTAPEQSTEQLTDAEWYGIWIFQDGYFSYTQTKIDRSGWTPAHFPDNPQEVGFDGGAGTFSLQGETIVLKYHTAFYPGRTGTGETLKFNLENDILTLTELMAPHTESLATGQRVTVLRRVK